MFWFKNVEVCTTFDPGKLVKTENKLKAAKIPYRVKTTNTGYGSRTGGRVSSVGEKVHLSIQYQVFVKKNVAEDAKAALR